MLVLNTCIENFQDLCKNKKGVFHRQQIRSLMVDERLIQQ